MSGSRSKARRIVLSLVIALVVLGAATAEAAPSSSSPGVLGCGGAAEQPFVRWGDHMSYVLVPNGGLEQGSRGWKLSGGARVVDGNEPFYVRSAGDRSSLLLPPGSSATTPATCVALLDPTLRYFSQRAGGRGALEVEVVYRGLLGLTYAHEVLLDGRGGDEWAPSSPSLFLANVTGLLALNGTTAQVSFRFTPRGTSTWRVDDVYVDPLKII